MSQKDPLITWRLPELVAKRRSVVPCWQILRAGQDAATGDEGRIFRPAVRTLWVRVDRLSIVTAASAMSPRLPACYRNRYANSCMMGAVDAGLR